MRRRLAVVAALLVSASLVSAARRRATSPLPTLDAHRSFAVTEQAILDGFAFERVMNAVSGGDGLALYQQWFDTHNPSPGLDSSAPHCDDTDLAGQPAYNGFARRCPTPEGALARTNPFTPPQYIPLALINRFDMTPADGANCGQYRMVFARKGASAEDRLHVIFEAVLPNPNPASGLAGCRPVAQFWADLSGITSIAERRARLEQFYFGDVVRRANYTSVSGGGIRAFHNTAGSGTVPRFYQYRLDDLMRPDTLEKTPSATFFDASIVSPASAKFRDEFIRQIPSLAVRDVNGYFIDMPREFLVAESDATPFGVTFNDAFESPEGQAFNSRIDAELRRIGSTLTTAEILRRAESQTCAGCHTTSGPVGDGVVFPRSFGFEHLSEERMEAGEVGMKFSLSPAMRDVFIPSRMRILRDFLASGAPPARSN
jgi:hypothetical protein